MYAIAQVAAGGSTLKVLGIDFVREDQLFSLHERVLTLKM